MLSDGSLSDSSTSVRTRGPRRKKQKVSSSNEESLDEVTPVKRLKSSQNAKISSSSDSLAVDSPPKKRPRRLCNTVVPSLNDSTDDDTPLKPSRIQHSKISSSSDSDKSDIPGPSKTTVRRAILSSEDSEDTNTSESDEVCRPHALKLTRKTKKPFSSDSESSLSDSEVESATIKGEVHDERSFSSDSDGGERCIICFKNLGSPYATPSNCSHKFHEECLSTWSKTSNTCPIDRIKYASIQVRNDEGGVLSQINVTSPPPQDHNPNLEPDDPTFCEVCNQHDREAEMLLCDRCEAGYHMDCLTPPLTEVPSGDWFCPDCSELGNDIDNDEVRELLSGTILLETRFRGRATRFPRVHPRTRAAQRVLNTIRQRANPEESTVAKGRRKKQRMSRKKKINRRRRAKYKVELVTADDGTTVEVKVAISSRKRRKQKRKSKKASKRGLYKEFRKRGRTNREPLSNLRDSEYGNIANLHTLDICGSRPQLEYFSGCDGEDELECDGGFLGLRVGRSIVRGMAERKQLAAQILSSRPRRSLPVIPYSHPAVDVLSSILPDLETVSCPDTLKNRKRSGKNTFFKCDKLPIRETPGSNHEQSRSENFTNDHSSQNSGGEPSIRESAPPLPPPPHPPFARLYEEEDIDLYADIEPPSCKLVPPPEPPPLLLAMEGDEGGSSPEDTMLVIDDRPDTYDPEEPTSPPSPDKRQGITPSPEDIKEDYITVPLEEIQLPSPVVEENGSECPNAGMYSETSKSIARRNSSDSETETEVSQVEDATVENGGLSNESKITKSSESETKIDGSTQENNSNKVSEEKENSSYTDEDEKNSFLKEEIDNSVDQTICSGITDENVISTSTDEKSVIKIEGENELIEKKSEDTSQNNSSESVAQYVEEGKSTVLTQYKENSEVIIALKKEEFLPQNDCQENILQMDCPKLKEENECEIDDRELGITRKLSVSKHYGDDSQISSEKSENETEKTSNEKEQEGDVLELGCEDGDRDGLVDITDEEMSTYEKNWEIENGRSESIEKQVGLEGLETEAISECEDTLCDDSTVVSKPLVSENIIGKEEGEIIAEDKSEPIAWKKLSKGTKERSYREKDIKKIEKENKEKKKEKKPKEKRKELERYDVRKLISDKPKKRKTDEFGRDISNSRSRSTSLLSDSRVRRRKSRERSVQRRSRGSRSRTRSRSRGRSSKQRKRSRSRSRGKRRSKSRSRGFTNSRSRSRRRFKSRSPRKEQKVRGRSRSKEEKRKRRKSTSSCSSCSCSSCERERTGNKKLTVIVPNKTGASTSTGSKKSKDKKKYKKSKSRRSTSRRRRESPLPSKEVFTSGDNILVSVNFKSSKTGDFSKSKDNSKKKRDEDVRRKKDKSSKENQPLRSIVTTTVSVPPNMPKTKKKDKLNVRNVKPIAIIDLDQSPFRELSPSPKEVIILSDSDNENKRKNDETPVQPLTTGPKTPPEPHIKFSISSSKPAIRITNPLLDSTEGEEREGDEEEQEVIPHKGPNTPPEPPVPYDPFEPTKSRTPTPGPDMDIDRERNPTPIPEMSLCPNRISPEPPKSISPPKAQHDSPKTPSPLHSPPKPPEELLNDKPKAPIYTPAMTLNCTEEIVDIIGGDSPYSPGTSEADDLFEPPLPQITTPTPIAKVKPRPIIPQKHTSSLKLTPSPLKKRPIQSKASTFKANKGGSGKKEIGIKLDEDQLKILDELPNSAVEMQVKDKFLKKLNRQERVVEEVKLVLKPHYHKKHVTKEEYKEILRKSVPKICHNKSGEINPLKIQHLVEAYVKKYRHRRKKNASSLLPLNTLKPKPKPNMWC